MFFIGKKCGFSFWIFQQLNLLQCLGAFLPPAPPLYERVNIYIYIYVYKYVYIYIYLYTSVDLSIKLTD